MFRHCLNLLLMLIAYASSAVAADITAVSEAVDRYRSGRNEVRIAIGADEFRLLEGTAVKLSDAELKRLEQPVLATGSKGEEVQWVQLGLTHSGHFKDEPDGQFGPATHDALIAFQRDKQLAADGKVGPTTWAALGLPEERRAAWLASARETVTSVVRRTRYKIDDSLEVESERQANGVAISWKKIPFRVAGRYPNEQWVEFLDWLVAHGLSSYETFGGPREQALLTFNDSEQHVPLAAGSIALSAEAMRLLKVSADYPPRAARGHKTVVLMHEPHSDVAGHLQMVDGMAELARTNPAQSFKFLVEGDLPEGFRRTPPVAPEIPPTLFGGMLSKDRSVHRQQVQYLLRNFLIDSPTAYRLIYDAVPAVAIDDQDALDASPWISRWSPSDTFPALIKLYEVLAAEQPRSSALLIKTDDLARQLTVNVRGDQSAVDWMHDTREKVRALAQSLEARDSARYAKHVKFLRRLDADLSSEEVGSKLAIVRNATMLRRIREHFDGPDAERLPVAFIGSFHTSGMIAKLPPEYGYIVLEPRTITHRTDEEARFSIALHDYERAAGAAMLLRKLRTLPPVSALPELRKIAGDVEATAKTRFAFDAAPLDADSLASVRGAIEHNGFFNTAQVQFAVAGGAGQPPPPPGFEAAFATFSPGSGGAAGRLNLLPGSTRTWDGAALAVWKGGERTNYLRRVILIPSRESTKDLPAGRKYAFMQDPASRRIFCSIFVPEQNRYYFFDSEQGVQGMEALLRPMPAIPADVHVLLSEILRSLGKTAI